MVQPTVVVWVKSALIRSALFQLFQQDVVITCDIYIDWIDKFSLGDHWFHTSSGSKNVRDGKELVI